MKYTQIDTCDFNNGDGIRITLWVSGCPLQCNGCHNSQLWDKNYGKNFDANTKNKIIELLDNEYISGLSILGGEPLAPYNVNDVIELCEYVKTKYPNKDIWLWSGYEWNYIKNLNIASYVDYIICGAYKEELKGDYRYFGSSNQKIYKNGIDITKLLEDKIVI